MNKQQKLINELKELRAKPDKTIEEWGRIAELMNQIDSKIVKEIKYKNELYNERMKDKLLKKNLK